MSSAPTDTSGKLPPRAAKNFANYVDFDLFKVEDTKGGFLRAKDDPRNSAMYAPGSGTTIAECSSHVKPDNLTNHEWERELTKQRLRDSKTGSYEPGIDVDKAVNPSIYGCRECKSLSIDEKFASTFGCYVCKACKARKPELYSLLTKTEVKQDYLLTEEELRDESLLKRMEKPNPHRSNWNNMMLFLRYQVEEYAFSDKRWGSSEALDKEYARRQAASTDRRSRRFHRKLHDLKRRTRVAAYHRQMMAATQDEREISADTEATIETKIAKFGDHVPSHHLEMHKHQWSTRPAKDGECIEEGAVIKICTLCGMEVEELDLG